MFVRISTETVLLRKATVQVTFFFSISVGKKKLESPQSWRRKRREEENGMRGRCCDKGAARSHTPFPFTRRVLLVQDGSVPFWNTSFLIGAVVKQCIVGQECLILLSFLIVSRSISLFIVHGIVVCISHVRFLWWYVLRCQSSFCCSSGDTITQNSRCRAITTITTTAPSGLFPAYGSFLLEWFLLSENKPWDASMHKFCLFSIYHLLNMVKGYGIISSAEQISTHSLIPHPTCTCAFTSPHTQTVLAKVKDEKHRCVEWFEGTLKAECQGKKRDTAKGRSESPSTSLLCLMLFCLNVRSRIHTCEYVDF